MIPQKKENKKKYHKKYKMIFVLICNLYTKYFLINLQNICYKNHNYNHKIYAILLKRDIKIYKLWDFMV